MLNKFIFEKKIFFKKNKYSQYKQIFDSKKKVLIFGAGGLGRLYHDNLEKKGIRTEAFIDNDLKVQGKKYKNTKIISLKEAKVIKNQLIIIGSLLYTNQIYKQLKKNGFKSIFIPYILNIFSPKIFPLPQIDKMHKKIFNNNYNFNILKVKTLLSDDESKKVLSNLQKFRITGDYKYIDKSKSKFPIFLESDILHLKEDEVYVDCGAYDGDTIKAFLSAKKNYNSIYAFEPDPKNLRKIRDLIKRNNLKNIHLLKEGVYNSNSWVKFICNNSFDSSISLKEVVKKNKAGKDYIHVTTIDDFFHNRKEKPTLIKMDIEGSEYRALDGAKDIIRKHKPKLAISVYHHPDHIWKIILKIYKINKNYKFYLRHLTEEIADTICYAV